jgi:histidyl-tRNA synthetase
VAIIGESEMAAKTLTIKDQKSGEQWTATVAEAAGRLLAS